jgi:hypothetical protein
MPVVGNAASPRGKLLPNVFRIGGLRWSIYRISEARCAACDPPAPSWRLMHSVLGMVTPALERWRHATKNPNAKLIFICHLMGGHIARYFLKVVGATLALHSSATAKTANLDAIRS